MKNIKRDLDLIYVVNSKNQALFTNDIEFIKAGSKKIPKKIEKYLQENPDCEYLEIINKIKLPK